MPLAAQITGIKYKTYLNENLKTIEINSFDINNSPSTFLLDDNKNILAISKWVSPKRTRSYPYERVYNSLHFSKKIGKDVSNFMAFSRQKAKQAQATELLTQQPKESLSTLSKSKITISNYLGGKYYFTVDEINIKNKEIELIEAKHSKNSILPSKGDIKDGLIKMLLYSNLEDVFFNQKKVNTIAILKLTSSKLKGNINSLSKQKEKDFFLKENNFSINQAKLLKDLFQEAKENSFTVKVKFSK